MDYVYLFITIAAIGLLTYKTILAGREQRILRLEVRRLELEIESDERLLAQCRLKAQELKSADQSEESVEHTALAEYNAQHQALVQNRKNEILQSLAKRNEIQTGDVMELLDIPRSTAQRYLRELEESSEISQIGERGAEVRYVRRKSD